MDSSPQHLQQRAAQAAKAILPEPVLEFIRRQRRRINFGGLRRVKPISRAFGMDRGQPVDRYYIERFLSEFADDVRGRVLEIGDATYTRRYGGSRVTQSDVLHVLEGNPEATIVADLAKGDGIPLNSFDCVICTQTLMFVYDVRAAVRTIFNILKPGGVALVTASGLSQICRWDMNQWGDYWRFTSLAARRLFEEAFPPSNVQVTPYGNVLAAIAFMHGLCTDDLRRRELDHADRDYEMIIAVRAVKPGSL